MRGCAPSTTSSTRETDDAPTQDSRDRAGRRRAGRWSRCCRPRTRRTAPPPASTVRGAFHIHSNRSDGSGSVDAIAAAAARAGLQFIILTDHGDGTRSPDAPAYRSGVLTIDGVELNTTGGHYAAIGLPAVAVSDRRHAGRCHRRRASARRIRHCGASGFAAAVAELAGLGRADRRPRVDQRRQRVARRAAPADRAGAADVSAARAAIDGDAARSSRQRAAALGCARRRTRQVVGLAGADAHARLGFRQRTDPDALVDPCAAAGLRVVVSRVLESCRARRAARRATPPRTRAG